MKLARDLTCAEITDLVTEYVEGGLAADKRARFEEHIGFCDSCLTYFDQMRQTVASIGRLDEDDLSPELQQSLLTAFRNWRNA
jgi:predicted anti-sigma-YlaC factor YlaD